MWIGLGSHAWFTQSGLHSQVAGPTWFLLFCALQWLEWAVSVSDHLRSFLSFLGPVVRTNQCFK